MIINTNSFEETAQLGFEIGQKVKKGDIYCLKGDLGVGKTIFTKGFARGMGLNKDITSPTFTIVNEYNLELFKFFHFDVYRINSIEEMYDLGYEEYFFDNGVCLIEWADVIKEIIPSGAIWINIKKDLYKGEDYRVIEVKK